MTLNVPGLIMMVAFYLLVFGIGIWASVKSKKLERNVHSSRIEASLLANRGISLVLGAFTMTGECTLEKMSIM